MDRILAEKSLIDFTELFFPIIQPGRLWVNNWHTDAICDHLMATVPRPVYKKDPVDDVYLYDDDGERIISHFIKAEISRLLIVVPPGCTKSLNLSVMFPPWVWGPLGFAQMKWLYISYAQQLSTRDSVYCREVIESGLYQEFWGDKFQLKDDQNEKKRYNTTLGGFRISTSIDGIGTGERVDFLNFDDPINLKDLTKPLQAQVQKVNQIYDTSLASRYLPETGTGIACMQRAAANDLIAHLQAKETGWEILCLPMEYTGENKCFTYLNFEDPREEVGELLVPERIDEEQIRVLKKDLGPWDYEAQYQQNPSNKKRKKFNIADFQIVNSLPSKNSELEFVMAIRYWDKAGTEGGGCYTAGVLMYRFDRIIYDMKGKDTREKLFYITDVLRGQWEAKTREPIIKQTAELDQKLIQKGKYIIWIEQEPGSGGKDSAKSTISNLAGFICYADKVTGNKDVRNNPYSVSVGNGNVFLVAGAWNRDFLNEHDKYGAIKEKDQVDAAGGAHNQLSFIKLLKVF